RLTIDLVVEKYAGTAATVRIEDLIEEIVGPIRDDYDIGEPEEIQFLSDHEVLVNARVGIDEIKDLLKLQIDEVDADSIGGLVYERLGDIPKPGATVPLGEATLVVDTVRRNSIRTVRIISPRPFVTERNGEPGQDEVPAHAAREEKS